MDNPSSSDYHEQDAEYGDMLNSAIDAFGHGDFDSAKALFRQVLDICEDEAKAHFYLGLIAAKQDFHEKAIEQFKLAISHDDLSEDAYLYMAKSFLEIDENLLATESLIKAYKLNSTNFDVNYHLAFAYFLQADYDKAIKYFDLALNLAPNNRDSYYYKAIALIRQDKYAKALKCFRLILDLYPNDHYTLYQKSLIYLNQNEKRKAIILLRKAYELGNPEAEDILKLINVDE